MLFSVVDDARVILRSGGVYRQVKLYARGDRWYAGWGAGFIRLLSRGATSIPHVRWLYLDVPPDVNYPPGFDPNAQEV